MIAKVKAAELKKEICGLVTINEESNLGMEISMPIIYPDGEHVTVIVSDEGEDYIVDDRGFGAMYLAKEGVPLNKRTKEKLLGYAHRYGCEFTNDKMFRRCSREQLATAIMVVANASRTIGDQAMEIKRRTENEFKSKIAEKLRDVIKDSNRLRFEEEYRGLSGRKYKVDNVILDKNLKKEVAFIESVYSRNIVLPRAAQIHDLKGVYANIHNDVALDDLEDWKEEDKKLFTDFGADHVFTASQLQPHIQDITT